MAEEKRKAPRFSLHQLIRLSSNREEFLQAEGINISLTGVLLHTEAAIDLYTTLFLMFEVETEEETYLFKTEGIVMRSEKENDYYSIGLQFTELTEEEKKHLKQYIEYLNSP